MTYFYLSFVLETNRKDQFLLPIILSLWCLVYMYCVLNVQSPMKKKLCYKDVEQQKSMQSLVICYDEKQTVRNLCKHFPRRYRRGKASNCPVKMILTGCFQIVNSVKSQWKAYYAFEPFDAYLKGIARVLWSCKDISIHRSSL